MTPKIVFMGSPEFAVPVLRQLNDHYPVVGVVSQPDRPAGRGRVLTPPPIKLLATELGLPIIQPRKLRDPEAMQQLITWAPDLVIVAAFGQILRPDVLDLPLYGCLNVHASLLPRWRGAAPIQAAILNGDDITGISIMKLDPGVDTGPILNQEATSILQDDTSSSLSARLSVLGADLLIKTLPAYLSGNLVPHPQDNTLATYAPMIKKEDGLLDFSHPAVTLERKVRAFNPWPGTFMIWNSKVLKIHSTHVIPQDSAEHGRRLVYLGLPAITTSDGLLVIDALQLAGKNIQTGKSFLQGVRNWGDEFALHL
jgi:methionyl-tRNA formyltransferase